jgi:hypothetical protein
VKKIQKKVKTLVSENKKARTEAKLETLLENAADRDTWPPIAKVIWRCLRYRYPGCHFFRSGNRLRLYVPSDWYIASRDYIQREGTYDWNYADDDVCTWLARHVIRGSTFFNYDIETGDATGPELWRYLVKQLPVIAGVTET